MAELVIQRLFKKFGAVAAVNDISITVADGEFLTLLGPSGCGKSTTLAAIAGLDSPDSGLIRAGGTVFFDSTTGHNLPAEARNCGLVFQSYALWPHMTVQQNLAFPLKLRKVPKPEQARRIEEVLALVEMTPYADRYPHQLSGGQQQRVALARTLVYEPSVLLLDEPLSNLDAKLRERARTWLNDLQQRVKLTTVYVTHDQIEALALSDRIAVMNAGEIVQIGTPREIYERPTDPFVADFIGTSSFLRGTVKARPNADREITIVTTDGSEIQAVPVRDMAVGQSVIAAIRPEKLRLFDRPAHKLEERGTLLPARVQTRSYLGARWQYLLEVAGIVAKVETAEHFARQDLWLFVPTHDCLVFDAGDGRVDASGATLGHKIAKAS